VVEIRAIHRATRQSYGSPRIADELREMNISCGRHRVARIMRENEIVGKQTKKYKPRTTDSKHAFPVAENLLDREFDVVVRNRYWVSDITYIWTREGWLYLAATLDLYSRRIVGWSMGAHVDRGLVVDALRMAVGRRRPLAGLLHHSDRGSQYASIAFRKELKSTGMICSMSHKGDCYDNAVMESFFGSLKTEWTQGCSYQTRAQAKRDVVEYIERFYNVRRRHSYLGNISPAEFERRMEQADLRKLSDSDALPGSRNDDLDDARLSTLGSSGCYTN
jgi:transposase InsO family protein